MDSNKFDEAGDQSDGLIGLCLRLSFSITMHFVDNPLKRLGVVEQSLAEFEIPLAFCADVFGMLERLSTDHST